MNLQWFNPSDFDSPDAPGSGGRNMDSVFLLAMDRARTWAGIPFIITSGYRTKEHNRKVGGVNDSAHTKGLAADIYTGHLEWKDVVRIVAALTHAGFRRIGVAPDFVHCDLDGSKRDAYWDYFDGERHKA